MTIKLSDQLANHLTAVPWSYDDGKNIWVYDLGRLEEPRKTEYVCRQCDLATARWFATDNIPEHGHVCNYCYDMMREDVQAHYARKE